MSRLFEILVCELGENGISVDVDRVTAPNLLGTGNNLVGEKIILDFTAHDKAFEDKIEELKRKHLDMIKTAEKHQDKRMFYERENQELKQHIAELESENKQLKRNIDKMTTSKSEWIDKAVEWQQKCEKLESNEKEKRTKINLNDLIKVKLTPLGAEIYYHQYDELNKKIKENGGTQLEPRMPKIDNDGYTEFQLHHFISLYGEHIGMCKPNVIEPINIVLVE